MIRLLLDPLNVTVALVVFAIATPALAWVLRGRLPAPRQAIALGAVGPLLLLLWGIQHLLFELIGFASVWSALIQLVLAVALGIAAGWYISTGANTTTKGKPNP